MDKETFREHLKLATEAMRQKCPRFITNVLPPSNRYFMKLNCSYDGNPLHQKEKVFDDHLVRQTDQWNPCTEDQVVERLWRDGYFPVWINVTPYEEDGLYSYFQLSCAGRFTDDDVILYHQKEGYPPFHQFGPILPAGWTSDSPKFDLHGYRDRKAKQ